MLLRPTLVLILLQLHASSTSTDSDKGQSVSSRQITREHPAIGKVQSKKTSHEQLSYIPLQDEDLLDLMVRIAQSPSEWERIQQVLSQLGKPENLPRKEDNKNKTYVMKNTSKNVDSIHGYSNSQISSVTSQPPTLNTENDKSNTAYHSSPVKASKDTDSGWPDFEEAILRKVKKPQRKSGPILQNGLFGNDWFDTSWSDLLEGEKDKKSLSKNLIVESPAVSFVKLNVTEGLDDKKSNSLRKSTYSGKNMFNLPSREDGTTHNEDYAEDLSSRISRPVFMYHRVTTSPQERKSNNAIIAVSVARREQRPPPSAPSNKQSTQRIQANLEDGFMRNFERHRSKERMDILDNPVSLEHLRHRTHH